MPTWAFDVQERAHTEQLLAVKGREVDDLRARLDQVPKRFQMMMLVGTLMRVYAFLPALWCSPALECLSPRLSV